MIAVWLLVACTGDSTTDSGDSGTAEPGPVYPTGERILLYTGHSGEEGQNSGAGAFDDAGEWIKDTYGWNVSDRSDLADPLQYRVMILVDSGVDGDSVFGESSVDLIREALDGGVRVVSVVSPDNCAANTLNPLFEDLGLMARYSGEGASTARVTVVPPNRSHQLTQDVTEARFLESCWVESNGATVLFADDRDVVMTVEESSNGEVVVVGDYSWFDDRGYLDDSDNQVVLGDLVEIDPDLGPLVDTGG